MNTPAGLMGVALLFWGWQIGWPWLGAGMGLILESSRWITRRWYFQQTDLDKIWNLCIVLFAGTAIYLFTAGEGGKLFGDFLQADTFGSRSATLNEGARVVLRLFQWTPLTLLPIALAQCYLADGKMDLSTFSWWLRRQRSSSPNAKSNPPALAWNIGYLYFGVCLFAASASPGRSYWFIGILSVLVGWALWPRRPRGYPAMVWGGAALGAIFLGIILQSGLLKIRSLLQRFDTALMSSLSGGRGFDLNESRTAIGSIGRLKLSGRILWRVESSEASVPGLIREGSYNLFQSPIWGATGREFANLLPEPDLTSWILAPTTQEFSAVVLEGPLHKGRGLLPLPQGTFRLEELPVFILQTNSLGMVRSEDGPGFVRFNARYDPRTSIDRPPDDEDLGIPGNEKAGLKMIANRLALPRQTPLESLGAVEQYFATGFQYSAWRGFDHLATSEITPLQAFLTQHRSGHCEYFATATALLLRTAGIPTRYAVGFAVTEKQGGQYIIRERHAHAWCLAWINNRWLEVDTTPGLWIAEESKRVPAWEKLRDIYATVRFALAKWRWGNGEWKQSLSWFVAPLIALVAVRLLMSKPWKRARQAVPATIALQSWPGQDSELFALENRLSKSIRPRRMEETFANWVSDIQPNLISNPIDLSQIVMLHYRHRFDPQGLGSKERLILKENAEKWLKNYFPQSGNKH